MTSITRNNTITEEKRAAIVWAPHERQALEFAKSLGAELHNVHYLKYKKPFYAPLKYILQFFKTLSILFRDKPNLVYVTNPPVFAPMTVYLYCLFSGASFIMDTHPPALYIPKWKWTLPLQRAMARRAAANIIDQTRYKELFKSWGAKAFVIERPQVEIDQSKLKRILDDEKFHVTVINTFDGDEDLDLIIEAARQLPNICFHILGDTDYAPAGMIENAPENVRFTGYIVDSFFDQLHSSNAVMVTTQYAHSLLAGALEGMVLRKPLILSDRPTLTEYFTKGTVFVEHTVEDMIAGIQASKDHEETLKQEIDELAVEKKLRWEKEFTRMLQSIND